MKEWMRRCLTGDVPGAIERVRTLDAATTQADRWDAPENFEALKGALDAEIGRFMVVLQGVSLTRNEQKGDWLVVRSDSDHADEASAPSGKMFCGLRIGGVVSGFFRVELGQRGFVIRYEVLRFGHDVIVVPLTDEPVAALRQHFGAFLQKLGEAIRANDMQVLL